MAPTVIDICKFIHRTKFSYSNEYDLQAGIAKVLEDNKVEFTRERILDARDRLDFLTSDGIAIEVKIDGSTAEVTRQLHRYAKQEIVKQIILVSTKSRHNPAVTPEILGKPAYVVLINPFW